VSTVVHSPIVAGKFGLHTSLAKVTALAAALLIAIMGLTFVPAGSAASAAETIAQCNGVNNTGGLGLACDVTVTNNLDITSGVASSTVTVKECTGAANTALTCTTTPTSYGEITSSVNQCNDANNGGGSSVICNVYVTNNITGAASTEVTDATINQCNGSGAEGTGPTLLCTPSDQSATSATITQCDGTANGGGAGDRVICTVTASTMSAQLPVSINQCNGTANGGGSVVTCTASLTNNIVLASATTPSATATPTPTPTPTPTATATPVAKNTLYDSKTDGFTHANSISPAFLEVGLLLAGLLTAAFAARRIAARR